MQDFRNTPWGKVSQYKLRNGYHRGGKRSSGRQGEQEEVQGGSWDRAGQVEPAEQREGKLGESWVRVVRGESISQRRLPLRGRAAKLTPSPRAVRIASCPPSSLPSWLGSLQQVAQHNCGGIPATRVGGGCCEQVVEGPTQPGGRGRSS